MQKLTKIALVATALSFSLSSNATGSKSDSELFAECKASIYDQIENVERIKLSNLSSRRGVFKAKLKVKADGQRSSVLCTIEQDNVVALTCTSGGATCPSSVVAAN